MLLSAAMIVRDEAGNLESCLQSIRDLVGEIVVVDTGSTDGSREIARRFGARVYDVPWGHDFAAARNKALGWAKGDWIFYIDADERVRPTSGQRLHELLSDTSLIGCYVWLHAQARLTGYREMRLFRNHPRIRFEGVIHENIWPGIDRVIELEGGEIGASDLVLDHIGYHGPQEHKHRRNLPLLLARLESDPDHCYSWWHLGTVYQALGDVEQARRAWRSGIDAVRRSGAQRLADSLAFVELIQLDFAQPEQVDPLLEEALRLYPDHAHLIWLRGQNLIRKQRWRAALADFERLENWRASYHDSDGQIGYDERLFNLHAYDGLAACHFHLGHYGEAERYFDLADHISPRHEYKIKRQLCVHLSRQAA